jgi:hypothetical protein
MSRKALGLVLACAFSVPAFAQKGKPMPTGAPAGDVSYKQKTVYDFDDDVVEGDLVRPDGEFVDSRKAAKHSSLIKIRENFIPEMLKSAEDI